MLIHCMIMKIAAMTIVSIVIIMDIAATIRCYTLLYPRQEPYRYL